MIRDMGSGLELSHFCFDDAADGCVVQVQVPGDLGQGVAVGEVGFGDEAVARRLGQRGARREDLRQARPGDQARLPRHLLQRGGTGQAGAQVVDEGLSAEQNLPLERVPRPRLAEPLGDEGAVAPAGGLPRARTAPAPSRWSESPARAAGPPSPDSCSKGRRRARPPRRRAPG